MPLVARFLLVGLVVCFAVAMLFVGSGMATRALGELGKGVSGVFARIAPSGQPTAAASGADSAPKLDAPDNDGYTNQATVTIEGSLPGDAVNKPNYEVRIYALKQGGTRKAVASIPVGPIIRFSAPNVPLSAGVNTFVAVLASKGVDGSESAPITYTLDTTPPPLTITAPTNGMTVVGSQVTVGGKTDPGAQVGVVSDQSSGGGDTVTAGQDGLFQAKVKLATGTNALTVTATDKAGNVKSTTIYVRRSLGKLSAVLSASPNRIDVTKPTQLVLTVRATASDGSPLANADVVFTLQVYGLGPIVSDQMTTDPLGRASFNFVVTGASPGQGTASVVVTTDRDGTVNGATTITTFKP